MRVLVACEYSGVVRDAFTARGHYAVSCDILPTESHPERHYQMDVTSLIKLTPGRWDLIVAFPPCTDLSVAGANRWAEKAADGRQQRAAEFFKSFFDYADKVAVENPVGWMNTNWRKPNQIIEPYYFGDPWRKKTCLWLKGLSALTYGPKMVAPVNGPWVSSGSAYRRGAVKSRPEDGNSRKDRAKTRSRTFQGIADAMAEQWG